MGGIHKFNPLVETSPLLSQEKTGLDSTRKCNFYDGTSVTEKLVAFEEGKSLKMERPDMSMPIKSGFATMTITKIDDTTSQVELKMDYVMKYGPLGKIRG